MAIDKRTGTKPPKWTDRNNSPGIRLDSGPYEAIVKNNLDPTRSGRLQVWIPDMGGDQNNPLNWRTVNYASPYMGVTNQPTGEKNVNNAYENTRNTYGFWAVPPDVGNAVLCTFIAGDPDRGYWFACVLNNLSHGMIPANGGSQIFDKSLIKDEELKKAVDDKSVMPLSEFNENDKKNITSDFYYAKRPIHEFQAKILVSQGLDRDPIRGAIGSSSMRDVPSQVVGISTPGRPFGTDPVDDPNYATKINEGKIREEDYAVRVRKGGHSIVMDDGEPNETGANQLMRFRTAAGHQILMNDTDRVIYIANSDGSAWVELAGSGHVHLFAGRGLNIRSVGDINLHTDTSMNINVGKDFNLSVAGKINMESNELNQTSVGASTLFGATYNIGSTGGINVQSSAGTNITAGGDIRQQGSKVYLNSGAGQGVTAPKSIPKLTHDNVEPDSAKGGRYEIKAGKITSIVGIAPTHEPWARGAGTPQSGGATATPAATAAATQAAAAGTTTGKQSVNDLPPPVGNVTAAAECVTKNVVTTGSGGKLTDGQGKPVTTGSGGLDPGPAAAQGKAVQKATPRSYLTRTDNPSPPGGVGPLSQYQVKCIMTAMGYVESNFNYAISNTIGYVGKYQFGAAALVETKFIKRDYYNNQAGNKNNCCKVQQSWTGRSGCNSLDDWFKNPGAQEQAMFELITMNYKQMVGSKAIKPDDDLCTIAGMICVAQLLGGAGARKWRTTAAGADAYGSTGEKYFNIGRYAIDVLANPNAK